MLGVYYSLAELHEESIDSTKECIRLFRELDDQPQLAWALSNLAHRYFSAGLPAESPGPQREARDIYRHLSRNQPQFREPLGTSSVLLGAFLTPVGTHGEAIAVTEEAVAIFRELGNQHQLAWALHNLAHRFFSAGRHAEAPAPQREACDIHRQLAQTQPHYRDALARSSVDLGAFLAAAGAHEEAITVTREGADLFRELGDQSALAWALKNLAYRLGQVGRHPEAVAPLLEARDLYALLTEQDAGYRSAFAETTLLLAGTLATVGQRVEAFTVAQQAVALYEQLVLVDPDQYGQRLAEAKALRDSLAG